MKFKVNRNIYLFAKVRYPWLKNLPNNWPMMVMMLEAYKPLIQTIMVNWRALDNGFLRVILMGLLKDINVKNLHLYRILQRRQRQFLS
ncbi:hypothetical protein P3S67_003924 [Capsicum chacoense]